MGGLVIHFLNVGVGDCTIVHFPERRRGERTISERIMMVDIYNGGDPCYENVLKYYKANFRKADGSPKPIHRFVCTHPHFDHICGLAELLKDQQIEILNFWDLDHEFVPEESTDDWRAYKKIRESKASPKVLRYIRETKPGQFWNDDEDRVTILSPSEALRRYAHYTDDGDEREEVAIDEMSYALVARFNSWKIVLAGDGRGPGEPSPSQCWDDIYTHCKDDLRGCTILKAGHHGQRTAFHLDAAKLMQPQYIIFSNSKEADGNDGAEKEYKAAVPKAKILKTFDGTIVMTCPFDSNSPLSIERRRKPTR